MLFVARRIHMNKGFFISVEGTDGSGKSTQIKLIEEFFINLKYDIVMVREPGGTTIGEKIREILLDKENSEMTEETEMYLYAASRAQLVKKVIIPSVNSGKIVICDRFVDSSLVYQGIGRGIGINSVLEVNKLAISNTMPDLTIFIEVDPTIALNRRSVETGFDRLEMEGVEFQNKIFNGYKELAVKFNERIKIIDGTKPVEEVFDSVKFWLEKLIGGCL
jgi:dTMP kinase